MNLINYISSLEVGGVSAFFVNKEMVGALHVYYVAYGPGYTISPFNEYGVAYTSTEITDNSLAGTAATNPVVNVPVESKDTVYVLKQSDSFITASHLGGLRESYEITGIGPQGVIKLELAAEDGVVTSVESATLMDISQIWSNPYYQ